MTRNKLALEVANGAWNTRDELADLIAERLLKPMRERAWFSVPGYQECSHCRLYWFPPESPTCTCPFFTDLDDPPEGGESRG